MNAEIPHILDAVGVATQKLFFTESFGVRFWLHAVLGVCVLVVAGKLFARWIANAEVRWRPLCAALLVPLFGWVLGWAAGCVWLVPHCDWAHPLVIETACGFVLWLAFAFAVALWYNGVTRTHAFVAVALAYVCFLLALFSADFCVGAFAKGVRQVDKDVQTSARVEK